MASRACTSRGLALTSDGARHVGGTAKADGSGPRSGGITPAEPGQYFSLPPPCTRGLRREKTISSRSCVTSPWCSWEPTASKSASREQKSEIHWTFGRCLSTSSMGGSKRHAFDRARFCLGGSAWRGQGSCLLRNGGHVSPSSRY